MNTNNTGLQALTTPDELAEVQAVGLPDLASMPKDAIFWINGVQLRRTFDMTILGQTLRFVRVLGPVGHTNVRCIDSDLSEEGLREWGII
jgi:hypothetical protein